MKVTSMSGSNRKKGNTGEILRAIEHELKKADIPDVKVKNFTLSDLRLEPCKSCLKCKKKGFCVIDDDFSKIAFRMLHSDLIILGSPVYFSDVSSQVKMVIDRSVSLWHTKQLKGKNLILAAACAEYGSEHTIETMKLWAKDHEMNLLSTVEGKGETMGAILKDEKAIEAVKNSIVALKGTLTPES